MAGFYCYGRRSAEIPTTVASVDGDGRMTGKDRAGLGGVAGWVRGWAGGVMWYSFIYCVYVEIGNL